MGYLIASLLFLYVRIRVQIGIAAALLLIFWGAMEFITVGNYGEVRTHRIVIWPNGSIAPYWDVSGWGDGGEREVIFATWYRYTWILSSLNFGVTVLTGLFAGYILKNKLYSERLKLRMLFGIGLGMVIAGWLWGIELPVIKKLWTSSMVLVSSGTVSCLWGCSIIGSTIKGIEVYDLAESVRHEFNTGLYAY